MVPAEISLSNCRSAAWKQLNRFRLRYRVRKNIKRIAGNIDVSDHQRTRSDVFIVTSSRTAQSKEPVGDRKSTHTVQEGDRRVHVTERASLQRAISAAMKDHRSAS